MRTVTRPHRTLLALACLSATSLVACGAGSKDESQSASSEEVGPLGELLGWGYDPAESRKKELEREEAVALCMKDAGYEYIPVDYAAQFPESAEQDEQFTNPEEFGKKYGYGIVFNYNLYERPGATGGADNPIDPAVDEGFQDPNWEYQQTLSPQEQEAYQETLSGDPSIWESAGDDPESFVSPPLEDQGCYGKAQLAVYGESVVREPRHLVTFGGDLQADGERSAGRGGERSLGRTASTKLTPTGTSCRPMRCTTTSRTPSRSCRVCGVSSSIRKQASHLSRCRTASSSTGAPWTLTATASAMSANRRSSPMRTWTNSRRRRSTCGRLTRNAWTSQTWRRSGSRSKTRSLTA